MGMKVVAEGAASREIWEALRRLDCDEAQGYYISPPLPAKDFRAWIERSSWSHSRPS
jgi:EAL domain-containing protein (putative c-di-GMP-specific phosphodiesterase class I)